MNRGGACFDDDHSQFLCAWTMNTSSGGDATLRQFAYTTPVAPTLAGTACSNAAIGWSGSQQIGSQFPAVTLSGAPANVFAILLVAWAGQSLDLTPYGLPACWLNVANTGPNFLGQVSMLVSGSGAATVPFPLPEFLGPADLWFQWFHFQAGANPVQFASTLGLRVPIVK